MQEPLIQQMKRVRPPVKKRLKYSLTPAAYRQLCAAAQYAGRDKSFLIEELITRYLPGEDGSPPRVLPTEGIDLDELRLSEEIAS
jgi:hypothetical protein